MDKYKELLKILEEMKVGESVIVKGKLRDETKEVMEAVEKVLTDGGFDFLADDGYGPDGTQPPKIPGHDRIPDFVVDRNGDSKWDMIIEVKSSSDWDKSDDQLKDIWKFCKDRDMVFWIVVPKAIVDKAEQRYIGLKFDSYDKFRLGYV